MRMWKKVNITKNKYCLSIMVDESTYSLWIAEMRSFSQCRSQNMINVIYFHLI